MWAIDNIDSKRGSASCKQVALVYNQAGFGIGKERRLLWTRVNLLSVDVSAVAAPQILDLNYRRIDVQQAMVTGNQLIPFRSRQLNEAIHIPSHLTPSRSAKAKPAVLVGPGKHREP